MSNKTGLWCETHKIHISDAAEHTGCKVYSSCGGTCGNEDCVPVTVKTRFGGRGRKVKA